MDASILSLGMARGRTDGRRTGGGCSTFFAGEQAARAEKRRRDPFWAFERRPEIGRRARLRWLGGRQVEDGWVWVPLLGCVLCCAVLCCAVQCSASQPAHRGGEEGQKRRDPSARAVFNVR